MARLLGALAIMTLVVTAAATPAGAQVFRPHTGKVLVANPVAAKQVERSTVVLAMRPTGTAPAAIPAAAAAAQVIATIPPPVTGTPGPITQPRQVVTPSGPSAPVAPITTVAARRPPVGDDATVTVEDDDAPAPAPKPKKKVKKAKKNSDEDGGDVVIVEDE